LVTSFFDLLYSIKLRQGGEDKICWIPSKKQKFEVRSFYHSLSIHVVSPFSWKSIWRVKAPLRVAFFGWMTTLGKILTLDKLRKRNVIAVDWCSLCKKSGESIDHLLIHCEVARELWILIFYFFGVELVMPKRVIALLAGWRGQLGSRSILEV
jgi:hypothetical protein